MRTTAMHCYGGSSMTHAHYCHALCTAAMVHMATRVMLLDIKLLWHLLLFLHGHGLLFSPDTHRPQNPENPDRCFLLTVMDPKTLAVVFS